jgi:hypothetical protein
MLGISVARLYELLADGEIPLRKDGRSSIILTKDLNAWADSRDPVNLDGTGTLLGAQALAEVRRKLKGGRRPKNPTPAPDEAAAQLKDRPDVVFHGKGTPLRG